MVDLKYREKFPVSLPLDRLRQESKLKGMALLQKGSRLSVQPVTASEWAVIMKLAQSKKG
jgi:predicted RNA-binding protein with PUA-like domain